MSQNPERESFADALRDAAAVFEPPDVAGLHGAAVRRGRQIRRRRAGAGVVGGAVALSVAGVVAFALPAAASHGTSVAVANSGAPPTAGSVAPSPTYPRPTAAPAVRSGGITAAVLQGSIEYALPAGAQVVGLGGPLPSTNIELVDASTHSWYAQDTVTIKSSGQFGTLIAVSVDHTGGSDTCSALNQGIGGGKGQCTRSALAGGTLLDEAVPEGVLSSDGVFEIFEWFSPTGYGMYVQLQDSTTADFAVTKAQIEALLTNQVFAAIAQALPADACVGGSFSQPVDPPTPGESPLQHVRCSTNGQLFPTY